MTPQRIKFIVENLTQRCDEDSRDALEVIAELQAELAIYKGRDQAKQLVIDRLKRELTAADEQLTERSITISALREKVANRESWQESATKWLRDNGDHASGCTGFMAELTDDDEVDLPCTCGLRELIPDFDQDSPAPTSGEQMEPICPACKGSGGDHPMALCSVCNGSGLQTEGFKALWQRWMGRAIKRGVIKERFTFHDLRAKCVSDNKSIEAAMQLAGHTNMAMTRRVYDRGVREVDPLE